MKKKKIGNHEVKKSMQKDTYIKKKKGKQRQQPEAVTDLPKAHAMK